MADAPPPQYEADAAVAKKGPPLQDQQPGMQSAGKPSFDELAENKLAMVSLYDFKQMPNIDDAVSCDCFPNQYFFTDANRPVDVGGKPGFQAVFVLKEESTCCARGCCAPCHPTSFKMYHASPVPTPGETTCGVYHGHNITVDPENPAPISTFNRPGCPGKCLGGNCMVCTNCCQDEMYVFPGAVVGEPGKLHEDPANAVLGKSTQPICGGGCTPTLELETDEGGQREQFGVVEGPTCFSGLSDLVCNTDFQFSSQKGKAGDFGMIRKQKPDSCLAMCCAVCSDVDGYTVGLGEAAAGPNGLSSAQKMTYLASAVQLDYMFFEKDNEFCYYDPSSEMLYFTCCMWYMCGAMVPVQVCISTRQG